jgi:hemerythrin-like domain-containing protein
MLPTQAPGFDDPLAMLRACHERILRQCVTLEKLVPHLRQHGTDADARAAAAEVHRYFSTAGRHHHEDEEQDLFPLLRTDPALTALLADLHGEHGRMEALWRQLEPLLAAPDTIRDLEGLAEQVRKFNMLYRAHIERENTELLPRAARRLPAAVLAVVGARMAARRGVSP